MKVKTSKGFTLAELLIVMAIMVVLAAIAIPTFGKQLETARETADQETLRAALTDAFSQAYVDYANAKKWTHGTAYNAGITTPGGEGQDPVTTGAVTTCQGVTLSPGQGAYVIKFIDLAAMTQSKEGFNYISPTFNVGADGAVPLTETAVIAKAASTADKEEADAIVFVFAPNTTAGKEAEITLESATLVKYTEG